MIGTIISDTDQQHCEELISEFMAGAGYPRWYAARKARDAVAVVIAGDVVNGEYVTKGQLARFAYLNGIYESEAPHLQHLQANLTAAPFADGCPDCGTPNGRPCAGDCTRHNDTPGDAA